MSKMKIPYKFRWPLFGISSIIGMGSLTGFTAYLRYLSAQIVSNYGIANSGKSLLSISRGFLAAAAIFGILLLLTFPLIRTVVRWMLNCLASIFIIGIIAHIIASTLLLNEKLYLKTINKYWNRFDNTTIQQIENYDGCSGFGNGSDNDCKLIFTKFYENNLYLFIISPLSAMLLLICVVIIFFLTCKKHSGFADELYGGMIPDDFTGAPQRKRRQKPKTVPQPVYTDTIDFNSAAQMSSAGLNNQHDSYQNVY